MPNNDRALLVDEIHRQLRIALVEQFRFVPMELVAAALAYELVSVLSTEAPTEARAVEALKKFHEHMIGQVQRHGVGHAHPVATELAWIH